ncbi:CAAX protease [Sporosarcina sp. P37]|uniref:YhfC family glutamic-type intramembrane protease n=1 Tax=unclassified Sporosarcina TaxID=2647733 RepID=UPI000A17E803|nr:MULTISPECIES: YhfC family glutamic-type intramembrane protease [unclassified Sporosarcina]ARK23842.1 CAAX protease [Sporosarcina sp. P37]PID17232.1 YhfC family intramembrane metalloprotease [Sporosarcina sp. P35]
MAGYIFSCIITIGLPLLLCIYAVYTRRWIPFLLGVLAFTVSQLFLRLPLLGYLEKNSIDYLFFSSQHPIWYAIGLGLSAALAEEAARYAAIRYFMKQRDWLSGFLFGAGHGGIESVILVGIPIATMYLTAGDAGMPAIAGVERFFAILLHIGLSILVLQAVTRNRLLYLILAIAVHTGINAMIGILPLFIPREYMILSVESILAIVSVSLFIWCILIKRKEVIE